MLYLFSLIKKKCLKHKRRLIFADIELTVIKKTMPFDPSIIQEGGYHIQLLIKQ